MHAYKHVGYVLLVKPPFHPVAFSFSSKIAFMEEIITITIIIIIIDRLNDNDNSNNV